MAIGIKDLGSHLADDFTGEKELGDREQMIFLFSSLPFIEIKN